MVQIATETEETEETERNFVARWAKHVDEKRYFRFNVEQGLQDIGLEEHKKNGASEAASETYLSHMAQSFESETAFRTWDWSKVDILGTTRN
jgi:hypothetical protein